MAFFDNVKVEDFNSFRMEVKSSLSTLKDELVKVREEINTKASDSELVAKEAAEGAQEAKKQVDSLKDAVNEAFNELKEAAKLGKEEAEEIKTKKEEQLTSLRSVEEKIEVLTEEYEAIFTKKGEVEAATSEIFEDLEKLNTAIEDSVTLPERYQEVLDVLAKVKENGQQVSDLLTHSMKRKSAIDDLVKEILGYSVTNEDGEEEKITGLKSELEDAYKVVSDEINSLSDTLDSHIENNNKRYKKVIDYAESVINSTKEEIESLLPGAMAAGLSEAYDNKAKNEAKEKESTQTTFYWAVGFLVAVSFIPVIVILYLFLGKDLSSVEIIDKTPKIVLTMLPIYLPIFWLAYSASKKINLSKRLIEEYTHKAVLGKTFTGLSKQIEGLQSSTDTVNDLRIQLLYNLLRASSENPGKLISDYNKSDHPLMEALENSAKLSDSVEQLSKFPGLSSLTKVIEQRAVKRLEAQEKKVTEGLIAQEKLESSEENASADT